MDGITLVALIITVILMLILAGVAISAVINNEGLFGKAINSVNKYEQAAKEEEQIISNLLKNVELQDLELDLENATELETLSNGNDIVLESKEYKITESIDVENCSIIIPANVNAKLYICDTVKINNKEYAKSGIDINSAGELELYIYGNTEITSGKGINGSDSTASVCGVGGTGAYAGIHVPEGATLKLYGNKEIYAYGGDAGDGGNTIHSSNVESSAGSGGGAGAGIGGNGGKGGQPYGIGGSANTKSIAGTNGENAGEIYIYDNVKVYAYGGSGGSAGDTVYGFDTSGSGGYPAAGIGGGGAGAGGSAGSGGDGSGGFSGSASQRWN